MLTRYFRSIDFSNARRNKYASRYVPGQRSGGARPRRGSYFGSSKEANDALRALAGIIKKRRHPQTVLQIAALLDERFSGIASSTFPDSSTRRLLHPLASPE